MALLLYHVFDMLITNSQSVKLPFITSTEDISREVCVHIYACTYYMYLLFFPIQCTTILIWDSVPSA